MYWWQRVFKSIGKFKTTSPTIRQREAAEQAREEVCQSREISSVKEEADKGRQEDHTMTFGDFSFALDAKTWNMSNLQRTRQNHASPDCP